MGYTLLKHTKVETVVLRRQPEWNRDWRQVTESIIESNNFD
jgi:hypothetical protein